MGRLDVHAMLDEMSWDQLREWHEYAQLEPFGGERADLGFGIVAATIANAHRGKNTKPFQPADFMPKFGEVRPQRRKPRTAEEFRQEFDQFKAMVKATAGTA